jgi:molybdopterin-guanine dinucleotide biosynthesis protein A
MAAAGTTAGVVLAGGRSTRMGTDKAIVEVGGVAMAVRVADALRQAGCDPVWCQGGDTDALAGLGLTVRPDRDAGAGPLAAIAAALSGAADDGADAVVVSACDLAWLDAATVRSLLIAADLHPEAAVVVAADAGGTHLLGVWRVTSLTGLVDLLASGLRSYRTAVERLGAHAVTVESAPVRNANRPADLVEPL